MKRKVLTLIVLVLILSGCAWSIQHTTQDERYCQALTFFNDTLEQYLILFAVADQATQAEWKKTYHPIFDAAGAALDAWGLALEDYTKEAAWNDAKVKVLTILVNIGLIEMEVTA